MDDDTAKDNTKGATGASAESEAYEVGYGKPPQHSRFKPGQSGNPKGRKRGSKSIGTLLREIMNEKVVVREGNRTRKITRMEAWLRQTTNIATKGDNKASVNLRAIMKDVGQIEPEPVNPHDDVRKRLADEDREIMKRLFPDRASREGSE